MALTARYPMAFDEQFHFGIIRLYSEHLSPFWNNQPVGAEQFGAITRDPSYLYQWLLSFPYRLISIITTSEAAQVTTLRLINVGILASALIVFRRVLKQLGASNAMRNVVLSFFILTPVVPLLGAQINYDNLMVLMTALAFTTYLSFRDTLRTHKTWLWQQFTLLAIICLFASLVKYAFLPLAAGLVVALCIDLKYARHYKVRIIPSKAQVSLNIVTVLYAILLVAGVGLFSERYIGNVIRYHTPTPECNQVLSIDECQGYAPWARNYMFDSWDIKLTQQQIVTYPFMWIHRALGETVFSITSRFNDKGTVDYYGVVQLVIPNILSWAVFVGGGLLAIFNWRRIREHKHLLILLSVSALYTLALFAQNLLDYLHLGLPVAIHGRYLIPIMPLLYLAIAYGVAATIQRLSTSDSKLYARKTALSVVVLIVLATQGGGFVTFIIRSHDDWFWPQSRPAQLANQYARDVLQYVVIR